MDKWYKYPSDKITRYAEMSESEIKERIEYYNREINSSEEDKKKNTINI